MVVNKKRVQRLMREDNLLAIRHRKFLLTTDSEHDLEVYLNLAARMEVTAINQLWVADITYIHLQSEFLYLAVSSIVFPGSWWEGRWIARWQPGCRWQPCNKPSRLDSPRPAWCTTPIAGFSMPPKNTWTYWQHMLSK